ncbi:MAG TPA: acyl-ACP--UDP-N-acetylglucosamine O-acyltransferase [Candidatus Marinimicrobia bacterium]|nr:acyl-ACP--UDP-N-acetylglucosamine O-acyltransferase [Candidatus Neomarinimicrobiota bacterium]
MTGSIHPTALIEDNVTIGENVSIGPYSWIRENVSIGNGSTVGSHVVLSPGSRIGNDCQILHHAVLGEIPQDLKFGGEETTIEIGDRTVIREFVTINRGTQAHWKTVVGTDCLIMAYVHLAHDCIVGNNVVIANACNIAGHVEIQDWVILGGMVGIHQFTKIGQHSLIGGHYRVTKDVPPFIIAAGEPLRFEGLNIIGLRRRGFKSETVKCLKKAYQFIYSSQYNVSDAVKKIREELENTPELTDLLEFINNSERGIIR